MTANQPHTPIESLLAEREWVRALARGLVADVNQADDLEQQTWLATARHPPSDLSSPRAWLGTVLRNLVRRGARGEGRRRVREMAASRSESMPSAAEMVARAETQRRVVEAVLALSEPNRDAILARFFEDMPPREIARRLGVPVETVRTRIKRGLAELRARLDAEYGGDGKAWGIALLPLVGPRVGTAARATLAAEVLAMSTKAKVLAAVVIAALAAFAVSRFATTDAPVSTSRANVPSEPSSSERAGRRPHADVRATAASATVDVVPSAGTEPADVAAERARWPIRVTTNVPGAQVTLYVRYFGGDPDPPPATKTADAKGFAGFPLPGRTDPISTCSVVARHDAFATARKPFTGGDVSINLIPGVIVRGHVVDSAGCPVAQAPITCDGKGDVLSEPDGSFAARADKPGAVALHVDHPEFVPRDVATTAPIADVRIVLDRGLSIAGRVAFPDLRPVPGVVLADSRGMMRARTDEDGRYVVSGLAPGPVVLMCVLTIESKTFEAGATDADFVVTKPVARIRLCDEALRPFRVADLWMSVRLNGKEIGLSAVNGGASGIALVQVESGARLLVTPTAPGYDQTVTTEAFDGPARLHDVRVLMTRSGPKGAIRIRVRDESDSTPPSVFLTVNNAAGRSYCDWCAKHADLDAHGRVDVPDVVAGRYDVTAAGGQTFSADGYWLPANASIQVDGERTTEVELTMAVGGRVRATIKDSAGAVVAPKRVELRSTDGARLDVAFVQFTEGGLTTEFAAAPVVLGQTLAPGHYIVAVTGPDGAVVTSEVDVVRGATTDVELRVRGSR